MRVLVTGALGNVGRSTVAALRARGDEVSILELPTRNNRALARKLPAECTVIWGDICDERCTREAVAGQEGICHLAALIPPLADRDPERTRAINVGGTKNLLEAARTSPLTPRFVFASSVAAYGDRLNDYWIRVDDPLVASPGDVYATTKIEAESLVRESGLPFSILRLTYIVWRKKLAIDPLLFHMPLATRIEVCHTEDTGRAFAAALHEDAALGATFNIGGGESCRTTFREYLDRMFALFGLGGARFLPETAFATSGFHCGWFADSDEAELVLKFRQKNLEDYYAEVKSEAQTLRPWAAIAAPALRRWIIGLSPFMGA